jgi:hypothetical protein
MIHTRACDGTNRDTSSTNQVMRRRKMKKLKMNNRKNIQERVSWPYSLKASYRLIDLHNEK